MFIELHIIQSFPPSNLNRDDTNQPKDCEFGGVRRARISSQCLKRATRLDPVFKSTTQAPNGTRSRFVARTLCEGLIKAGKPEQEARAIADMLAEEYSGGLKEDKETKEKHTEVALYLSPKEVEWAISELQKEWKKSVPSESMLKKVADDLAKLTKHRTTSAPDIALFGRMLAKRPDTNIDAACQVTHAISTHAVKMDLDYFTAVDELAKEEETGAAMIGTAGFNSACFYRYARLDWTQLKHNLEEDEELARDTVKAFLLASEAATPTGKKNSHDNNSRPAFMLAVARAASSAGWSLVNAFEKPVNKWGEQGLVEPSVKKLGNYWDGLCEFYGTDSVLATAVALHPTFKPEPDEWSKGLQSAVKTDLNAFVQTMLDALAQGARK